MAGQTTVGIGGKRWLLSPSLLRGLHNTYVSECQTCKQTLSLAGMSVSYISSLKDAHHPAMGKSPLRGGGNPFGLWTLVLTPALRRRRVQPGGAGKKETWGWKKNMGMNQIRSFCPQHLGIYSGRILEKPATVEAADGPT